MSDEAPKRTRRALSASEKAKAIALWRAGEMTIDQLAEKFKRDRSTFLRLFKKEGASKGETQQEHQRKVQEAVQTGLIDDAATMAKRIKDTKEDHYKMAVALASMTWQTLKTAKDSNQPYANVLGDMKALRDAAAVLKVVREERYAVLGLNEKVENDDGELPDLMVQELTAQQIETMHREQKEGINPDGDLDIEDDSLDLGEIEEV